MRPRLQRTHALPVRSKSHDRDKPYYCDIGSGGVPRRFRIPLHRRLQRTHALHCAARATTAISPTTAILTRVSAPSLQNSIALSFATHARPSRAQQEHDRDKPYYCNIDSGECLVASEFQCVLVCNARTLFPCAARATTAINPTTVILTRVSASSLQNSNASLFATYARPSRAQQEPRPR
ncbi:unnamed protein product [Parnassius apollo]|uniref:(apollo) hypothetical protein n=1 Tax=Parnassius apollo TaxID=110799 RepID=A0A8S3WN30_PARAO|nr:unnamed protein product [Parnassius apollo]